MTKILLIGHYGVGSALRAAAESILDENLVQRLQDVISFDEDRRQPERLSNRLEQVLSELAAEHDVLILSDLPGASPHNLAVQVAGHYAMPVVSGMNLPMLLRCIHHQELTAMALADIAVEGARRAIFSEVPHGS